MIICQTISGQLSRLPVVAQALLIERDEELFTRLTNLTSQFSFAEVRLGAFADYVDEIQSRAKNSSVFLYLDPYTVEGLVWSGLESIFQHLHVSRMSIEVLLNFNAQSFVRRGLAALRMHVPDLDSQIEDAEEIDAAIVSAPSVDRLNAVVGGPWWQERLRNVRGYPKQVQAIVDGVCVRLRELFRYVCQHPIKALPNQAIPKYYLVFASRHPDALVLMNDEMAKSREVLADLAKPLTPTLFETRNTDLIPDVSRIPNLVLKHTDVPIPRGEVIVKVVEECFCQYRVKEIRGAIENLLRAKKLKSETGKTRINDRVKIWRTDAARDVQSGND